MDQSIFLLAQNLGQLLLQHGWRLVTAESCTGGFIAKVITDVSGSSAWFECGFVTYSNESKQDLLGVTVDILAQYGAVSEAVVMQMARGALANSRAQVALAISGIAGPGGGSPEKPVGTVWLAWCTPEQSMRVCCERFIGSRKSVRQQSVKKALEVLIDALAGNEQVV